MRVDRERRFEFAESISAGAQDHRQLVGTRYGVKLILIAIRQFGEFFPLILLQVQVDGIAEPCADRAVRLVGNAQHVQVGVILSLVLVELKCIRWRRWSPGSGVWLLKM